uniref:DM2 domain-containing protein n=1 Tax=viral metagenome TaxID=1070528 RepID=A0A6C0K6T2_9ZZZZ
MPPTPSKKQPVASAPVVSAPVVSAPAAAPAKEPVVSATAAAAAAAADSQAKKKKPVVLPTAPVAPVAATAPVVVSATATAGASASAGASATETATAAGAPTVDAADNVLSNIIDKVNSLAGVIKDIQTHLKVLSKEYDKQQKIIEKAQKKRQNAKNSPSGFAKPNKISDELCDFIGVPHGTEKSRTDITRLINAYVKEHNLNKPENKRFILPDAKLKKILNVGDSEEINYFILQKLISHHFPASASKAAAKAPVAV